MYFVISDYASPVAGRLPGTLGLLPSVVSDILDNTVVANISGPPGHAGAPRSGASGLILDGVAAVETRTKVFSFMPCLLDFRRSFILEWWLRYRHCAEGIFFGGFSVSGPPSPVNWATKIAQTPWNTVYLSDHVRASQSAATEMSSDSFRLRVAGIVRLGIREGSCGSCKPRPINPELHNSGPRASGQLRDRAPRRQRKGEKRGEGMLEPEDTSETSPVGYPLARRA
ncbi:hypothetical protein GQ53DRAFT_503371 [Thozetella sp. PMI_491]|nr:hypothetical protein GQ53DRAFT_503371 [Thozetella sp. PMI_491]